MIKILKRKSFNRSLSALTPDQYLFLQDNARDVSVICGFDFEDAMHFSYGFLKSDLPQLMKAGDFEALILEMFKNRGVTRTIKQINNEDHNALLAFVIWIKRELQRINLLEVQHLTSVPKAEVIAAGISDFDVFGEMNVIDALAGGDILKWDEVEKLPYMKVFVKQRKNKVESVFQDKYAEIMKIKSKNGHS